MITKKDAIQIREVMAEAMAMCTTPEERQGVMRVDSMFVKQWSLGELGFNESLLISEYIERESHYRKQIKDA